MPSLEPHPDDPTRILTSHRIGAALAVLSDPHASRSDPALQLDENERQTIAHVLARSSHPLGGFAQTVLDQWDHLEADDHVAGLLLFAEITRRQQRLDLGVER